jgi:Flp pilus assembly protein TadG
MKPLVFCHNQRRTTVHCRSLVSWKQLFSDFGRDTRGQITVLCGLTSVPLVMAGTIAVDMANVSDMKTSLQAAADSAVLAAATRLAVGASEADKEQIAIDMFYANLSTEMQSRLTSSPTVNVDFPTKTVAMSVFANASTVVSDLVMDDISIGVRAVATVSPGTPICMMALNPHAQKSINIQGTADLIADDCAVHVNSDHAEALYQTGTGTGAADSFCVHGGHSGSNFTPSPRDRFCCEPVSDRIPY